MKQYRIPALAGAVLLGLTACGGGNNDTPPLTGAIRVANGTQGGFPAKVSPDKPASGQVVVQPVHAALVAAAGALSLNFYFVKPGDCAAAVVGATANASAAFKASSAAVALASGTYEICVTDAAGTVLFDSGTTGIALPTSNANVFQIAAYDAPSGKGRGSSLVLSLLDNAGGNTALYNLGN